MGVLDMMFSSRKVTPGSRESIEAAGALFRGIPARQGNAPGAASGAAATVQQPAEAERKIITRYDDVPDGILISGANGKIELPSAWRDNFALLLRSSNTVLVVVAETEFGRPVMLDVIRRVKEEGYRTDPPLVATQDIVKLIYESNRTSMLTSSSGTTEIEVVLDKIIEAACAGGASDVHIETRGDRPTDVFFRINGIRVFYGNLTTETARSLAQVLQYHADAGSKSVTWDPSTVIDGATERTLANGQHIQLRYSSAPIYPSGNFHLVIRILHLKNEVINLDRLGYTSHQLDNLDNMSAGSSGLVLICGPTGSGKSTTLQGVIGRLFSKRGAEIKIITVEDPVEYLIPGACQIPVARNKASIQDASTGSVFTTFLRGTLRQDPDVVMVGEIRDIESAVVTRDLVLSGRKVFATLHTYSALWAFMRLREIGLPWEVITMPGFIGGIVYQRLLPVVCPTCGERLTSGAGTVQEDVLYRLKHIVDLQSSTIKLRGRGCNDCGGRGYIGRTVVSEFVIPDRGLLQLLAAGDLLGADAHWKKTSIHYAGYDTGGKPATVLRNAIMKMSMGLISPLDIENQIGLLTTDSMAGDLQVVAQAVGTDPRSVRSGTRPGVGV